MVEQIHAKAVGPYDEDIGGESKPILTTNTAGKKK